MRVAHGTEKQVSMDKKFVITVGRQYGSGGRELGKMLSEIFGIGYYDKELISEAARRSGLADETFRMNEDRPLGGLLHALSMGYNFSGGFSQESIFKIQTDTIYDIASKESCVIVGRCADYVLRDNPRCINLFIYANAAQRAERVARRRGITEREAADLISKTDKSRASYYNFYTDKQWGYSTSYHLCVDSSILGLEKTAQHIASFIRDTLSL